jgi:hypothetical protein
MEEHRHLIRQSAEWRCFKSPRTVTQQKWSFASVALTDAYTDFILSRQAIQCSPAALGFHKYTAGKFLLWLE